MDPGVYLLSATYRGVVGPETVLAIGKGFGGGLLYTLFGSFAIAVAGIGLALAITWKVFLRRRETGRDHRPSMT